MSDETKFSEKTGAPGEADVNNGRKKKREKARRKRLNKKENQKKRKKEYRDLVNVALDDVGEDEFTELVTSYWKRRIISHLSKNKVYIVHLKEKKISTIKRLYRKESLSARSLEQYERNQQREYMFSDIGMGLISEGFQEAELKVLSEASAMAREAFSMNISQTNAIEIIHSRVKTALVESLDHMVKETFTYDYGRMLILKNPHCREFVRQTQRQGRLENEILQEIPDNPADFYPTARSMVRHFILHLGPTNSGKTYEATKDFRKAQSGIYLGPLRLLALEVYEEANREGTPCELVTGEEILRMPGADHQASTVEMLPLERMFDVAVIDEAQMVGDPWRGGQWTRAIMGVAAKKIHVCASPEAKDILTAIIDDCGDTYEIMVHERHVPLLKDERSFLFPEDVEEKDALIVFSKKRVHEVADVLRERGVKCSMIYGALPPEVRRQQTKAFISGENEVVVATDAIGMGLNLPIKRVVFMEHIKFDGMRVRPLQAHEFLQIAGRAGRRGIFDKGFWNAMEGKELLEEHFQKSPDPINSAYLIFPERLIALDAKLSETLRKWSVIRDGSIYQKSRLKEMLILCEELEKISDDKELIYKFLTIPFDERRRKVHALWRKLFILESKDKHYEYDPQLLKPFGSLEMLELKYKQGDLLNSYYRHIGDLDMADLIMHDKRRVADEIIEKIRLMNHHYA